MEKLTLKHTNKIGNLTSGSLLNIPFTLQAQQQNVTAISIIAKYPTEFIEILGLEMVPGNEGSIDAHGDEFRIGWFSSTPLNEFTLTVKCRVIKDVPIGTPIEFTLYDADPVNILNELAGGAENDSLYGIVLETVSYTQKSTIAARKLTIGYTSKPVVPCCGNCAHNPGRCEVGDFKPAKGGLCPKHLIALNT